MMVAVILISPGAGAGAGGGTGGGLEKGEEAILTISHEGSAASEELFFKRDVRSDGKKATTVDIAANLEDGYYQLLLEAPDKAFGLLAAGY